MSPVPAASTPVVVATLETSTHGHWHDHGHHHALPWLNAVASVRRVFAALHWLTAGPRHVSRLGALVAGDDVELDLFAVADAAQVLARVVASDGRLVDEYVLLGVVAVDKAVAVLHVEPLHRADNVL